MTDQEAFLAAIIASPADDLPRLVYADWLEEQGDEKSCKRAYRIRLECENPHWEYRLPVRRVPGISYVVIRRGFIERLECELDWWMAQGWPARWYVKWCPITRVTITDSAVTVTGLPVLGEFSERWPDIEFYFVEMRYLLRPRRGLFADGSMV